MSNMITLLSYITSTLQAIHPASYYEYNLDSAVSYPYLTYEVDTEETERFKEVISLDIDIFDYSDADVGAGYVNIFQLESALRDALAWRRDLNDILSARWAFVRSTTVPTRDKSITRRNLQFQITIDWRNI